MMIRELLEQVLWLLLLVLYSAARPVLDEVSKGRGMSIPDVLGIAGFGLSLLLAAGQGYQHFKRPRFWVIQAEADAVPLSANLLKNNAVKEPRIVQNIH